jgi:DNA-binding winged helix-turn-helix (wHTH) protein
VPRWDPGVAATAVKTTVVRPVRYRFGDFVLAPRQRLLLQDGTPVPLIPKYFDLLVLLVERRHDAVPKDAIFSAVWSDVIVSDGALAQAVRTLRRTLGDNPREPKFIRTVSRHGYQFVYPGVAEEPDDVPVPAAIIQPAPVENGFDALVDRLLAIAGDPRATDEARDLAERLHTLGTDKAVVSLSTRRGHSAALALMRDTRWNVPKAGGVPLDPAAALALVRLRMRDAGDVVARRWAGAALAGATAGALAGALGGLLLFLSPDSSASLSASLALAALGALAGGAGAAGIGAGLAAAEALARSHRGLGLVLCGVASGLLVSAAADLVLRAMVEGLVGHVELTGNSLAAGLAIGGTAGLGYALATRQPPGGGLAAPEGRRRVAVAAIVAAAVAVGAAGLALAGGALVGGIVNEIAGSAPDAQLALAPLGRLIGEPDFGRLTRLLLSAFEGGAFGFALAWGLTARPRR